MFMLLCNSQKILIFLIVNIAGELVLKPDDMVKTVGEEVIFVCQTNYSDKYIQWDYKKYGAFISDDIYTGLGKLVQSADRYEVRASNQGVYDFVIKNVTLRDAGEHRFKDNDGFGRSYKVELVVLDSSYPACRKTICLNVLKNKDKISISCTLRYLGNLSPSVSWKDEHGKPVLYIQYSTYNYLEEIIVSPSFFDIDVSDTSAYTFHMTFKASKVRNSSDFRYTWSSAQKKTTILESCDDDFKNNVLTTMDLLASNSVSRYTRTTTLPSLPGPYNIGSLDDYQVTKQVNKYYVATTMAFSLQSIDSRVIIAGGVLLLCVFLIMFASLTSVVIMKNRSVETRECKTGVNDGVIASSYIHTEGSSMDNISDVEYAEIDESTIMVINPENSVFQPTTFEEILPQNAVYTQLVKQSNVV